jgi:hypothetical protein
MRLFISGMLVAGYTVAAAFFARFWRDTHDRLFIFFAAAFGLLALHRVSLAAASQLPFAETTYYVMRLLAYLTILVAIIDRNRR